MIMPKPQASAWGVQYIITVASERRFMVESRLLYLPLTSEKIFIKNLKIFAQSKYFD